MVLAKQFVISYKKSQRENNNVNIFLNIADTTHNQYNIELKIYAILKVKWFVKSIERSFEQYSGEFESLGDETRFYQGYQLSMSDLRKATSASKQAAGCLFTNFEDVRLTDEERVYLNAAATGDIGIIRMSLEDTDDSIEFNVNCVDYMGRNALHLAVDSENTDVMEMLLDKLNFECIEEALLHAISKGHPKLVRVIIEHPNYQAGEDQIKRMDSKMHFFGQRRKVNSHQI
ncbi:unnamed protein product [Heterobilharzia americana]|nr:unnamed protein product [Heterobilharzia americana]